MKPPDPKQTDDDASDEGDFARFRRKMDELMAERELANPRPKPPPPSEPEHSKPGTLIAAEKELLGCELLERLQLPLVCGGPDKCERDRCRRARRCSELEEIKAMTAAARANLARERAKWRPSERPPEPPRKAARRRVTSARS